MGFLDSKEVIFDVVLTDRGRELLSQNLLDFEYYAFSDEGVDYATALSASISNSSSLDEEVSKNTQILEGDQRSRNRDLGSFLYTIPPGRKTLPEIRTNFDDRGDINLKRRFYIDLLLLRARPKNGIRRPISTILRATIPKKTRQQRLRAYALRQKLKDTESKYIQGKNVVGEEIADGWVIINDFYALNTTSGLVRKISSFSNGINTFGYRDSFTSLTQQDEVEVVVGLSRAKVDFTLKSSEGPVDTGSGFLIEVFESGSDGKLRKIPEESLVDALSDEKISDGFEEYLFLDVDVDSQDIISQAELIQRRETRKKEVALQRLRRRLGRKLSSFR